MKILNGMALGLLISTIVYGMESQEKNQSLSAEERIEKLEQERELIATDHSRILDKSQTTDLIKIDKKIAHVQNSVVTGQSSQVRRGDQ